MWSDSTYLLCWNLLRFNENIPKVLFILFRKIYVWQKVYNFFSDGYTSLKNLNKFSLIYQHKYA